MNQQRTDSAGAPAPQLWRALEERVDAPAFQDMMAREFPDDADVWTDPVSRRRFMALAAASLGLAGMAGCYKPPRESIVPYVNQPEQLVLGKPLYYATAMPLAGSAMGVLVESHEGRPTKVEGNPGHPLSLGATDVYAQASVLSLWDPDRSQSVMYRSHPRSWEDALREVKKKLPDGKDKADQTTRPAVLRILTDAVASPTMIDQLHQILERFPGSQWVEWEPALAFTEAETEGTELVFGKPYAVHYDLTKADVVLALDADFLGSGPEHVKYSRDFASRRRVLAEHGAVHGEEKKAGAEHEHKLTGWSRLYAIESTPTATGMFADHRLALAPNLVEAFAHKVAEALEMGLPATGDLPEIARPGRTVTMKKWIEVVAEDLKKPGKGKSLVVAGEGQPASVHALALAINDKLGNIGSTVTLTELPEKKSQKGVKSLQALTAEMAEGKVGVLLILGPNPIHSAPIDVDFAAALRKVPFTLHHSLYVDETSVQCQWHLPATHYLESWGDVVAHDGTATIMQPLIAPLYHGRPAIEVLSALLEEEPRTAYDLVRSWWQNWRKVPTDSVPPPAFEKFWTRAVHDGTVAGYSAKVAENLKDTGKWKSSPRKAEPAPAKDEMTLVFRLDPTLFDGRFANNGWLQEVPKPVTKLTWGNAALISPKTAEDRGITQKLGAHGGNYGELVTDIVELKYRGRPALKVPVYVQPGQPDGVVTVHLGHGRERAGRVGNDYGFNAARLWTADAPLSGGQLTLEVTKEKFTLACTQVLQTMGSKEMSSTEQVVHRAILRFGTVDEYNDPKIGPEKILEKHEEEPKSKEQQKKERTELTMFASQSDADASDNADPKYWDKKHQWGMVIDLGACTGCSACVVACQAENNISVVGKEQVTRGRAMHWLRIDRYFLGDENETVNAYTQPVPCMQCENAPCELVCPVEATSHSPDGVNEMTYNRCVGTRYCANNCPYKVRRFNFLEFADYSTKSLFGLRNPDVTVRTRGVMEKCTYCVQRIRVAGIEARNQHRDIKDGEIVTACEAACPSQAIVFGNTKDPNSRVSKLKGTPVNYGLLEELNTRPRTSYLAALKNPNVMLEELPTNGH